jgi:hypothetical protein
VECGQRAVPAGDRFPAVACRALRFWLNWCMDLFMR